MRILANSASSQAAEPTATVAGRIGGHDAPTGGDQRAGRVRLGGVLSANGESGRLRDVNGNRHSRGDGWAAGQPVGALEEAGLAGGVRPAGDLDRVRTAGRGLQLRRREIDARAFELRLPVEWQGSVAGAGGDDHRSRLDSGVVGQHDPQTLVGGVQPGSLAGACDTGTEFLCLHCGAAGQLSAADAGGEPEVVLDPRAGCSLPASGDSSKQQRPQAFRRAVDRGSQSSRASANDDQIQELPRRRAGRTGPDVRLAGRMWRVAALRSG